VVSLPEVLVALYALPEVAHRIGSVFRSLFGIDTLDTAVTDTTAFGEDWQFDLDAVVIQFGELTPDVPRSKEDCVVRSLGELQIPSD